MPRALPKVSRCESEEDAEEVKSAGGAESEEEEESERSEESGEESEEDGDKKKERKRSKKEKESDQDEEEKESEEESEEEKEESETEEKEKHTDSDNDSDSDNNNGNNVLRHWHRERYTDGKLRCVGTTLRKRQCQREGPPLPKKAFFLCPVHLMQLADYEKAEKARHKCSRKCPKYVLKDARHCKKCVCTACVCLCALCSPKLLEHPQNMVNSHCQSCTCRYCVCAKHRSQQMEEMPRGDSSCTCKAACNVAKWRGTAPKGERAKYFALCKKVEQKMRNKGITGEVPAVFTQTVDKALQFLPQELPLLVVAYLEFFPYEKVCVKIRRENIWQGDVF